MVDISRPRVSMVVCFVVLVIGSVDPERVCNEETDRLCLSQYKTKEDLKMLVIKQFEAISENEQMQEDLRQLVTKQAELIVAVHTTQKDLRHMLDEYSATIREQSQLIVEMNDTLQDNNPRNTKIYEGKSVTGTTFVRWGRTFCPGNGTDTVYNGYVGGSFWAHTGAAVNYLCLPTEPLWDKFESGSVHVNYVYGTEYEIGLHTPYSKKLFDKEVKDHDAPCAVCHSVRSSTMMIPGRNACYDGWTMEYAGYLVSGRYNHKAASEFVCLDKDPELLPGSGKSLNGKIMYPVEAKCGSLKCPPYIDGRTMTCVVCSR